MGLRPIDNAETPRWQTTLARALPFLIGIPLVVAFGALLYFAGIAANERESALTQQQNSYEIIALARRLDGSVAKAESNLARYVISMDADVGRLYQEQWRKAGAELQALKQATATDPLQKRRVFALEQAYGDRGKRLSDIGLRVTYDQKSTALGKFYEAGKAEDLKRITSALDAVIQAENSRLAAHSLDVTRTSDQSLTFSRTYRIFGLALLIALLSLAWYVLSVIEDRRSQKELATEESNRARELEQAVESRTDELQRAYAQLQRESTERAAAEENLRQMQKLEAVGQLTGGIAHDFNNMLSVVIGGMELAKRNVTRAPDEAVRHLDNAMEGATRASALTRRLLAFARSEPTLPEVLEPEGVLTGMTELIDRTLGDQIRVSLDLDAGGWALFADRHQLENAVVNLAVNARDAMEGRGQMIVGAAQARLDRNEVGELPPGEYVRIFVTDSGCGMSAEVMERVFDPFFTTKPVGKGTGLGLSQVFGFVRQSNGDIRISSQEGRGTTVEMYLPRHIAVGAPVAAPRPSDTAPIGADPLPGRRATILLVEDDPRVLAQTRAALTELGHTPICRDTPSQCVEALREHPDIALILSDVMMPEITGPEMIASLPPEYRDLPVLFVTGYAGNVQDNRLFEGHRLLRKPYTLAGLASAIDAAISESPRFPADAAAE